MKRTVKFLVCSLLLFVVAMPSRACWWSDYDDWYSYDYDNDYNYNDYGNDSYDFENYDIRYDYENYEDSYDDIYIDDHDDDNFAWDILLNDVVITGNDDAFWNDAIFIIDNSWLSDGEDPNDYNDPPSNDVEPTDPPGTNEGDGGGGTPNTGNTNSNETIKSGEPQGKYWLDDSRRCSVEELKYRMKYYKNSNVIQNLPSKFKEQGQNADCTARAIATAAWLSTGDVTEYDYVIQMAYVASGNYNIDISINGVLSTNYMQMYNDFFDIIEIKSNNINENTIRNYIDSNQSVIGTFCTGEIEYVWNPPIKGAHDVTIIGYTDDSYICAYGREDVLFVPKEAIESHTIHVLNGIKDKFIYIKNRNK